MNKKTFLIFLSLVFCANAVGRKLEESKALSDSAIRQKIVKQSIAAYSGNCPCPFNTMRNGHACGSRSAYSRPGGASPICYAKDVSKAMVDNWRAQHVKEK